MSDFAEFPKCLYQGNDILSTYVVVKDESEEAEANERGFGIDAENTKKDMTAAELKAALTEKNVSFSATAKKAELQALFDAIPAE